MDRVVDHFQHPRNHGLLADCDVDYELVNEGCGDRVRLQARLGDADKLVQIGFVGNGCALSMASASILTTIFEGRSLTDVVRLTEPEVLNALEIAISPRRVDCALLPYRALRLGLVRYAHSRRIYSYKQS